MTQEQETAILPRECQALERWAQGDPLGYADIEAKDITYFDDVGAHQRIDGIAAMREYLASLEGKIPPHRYDVVNPKVVHREGLLSQGDRYLSVRHDGLLGTPQAAYRACTRR